jgi:hypothetical protein
LRAGQNCKKKTQKKKTKNQLSKAFATIAHLEKNRCFDMVDWLFTVLRPAHTRWFFQSHL